MKFNFLQYIEQLSRSHHKILHDNPDNRFYRFSSIRSMEEVFARLLSAKTPAVAVADSIEGRLLDMRSDNITERNVYSFYLLGRTQHLDSNLRQQQMELLSGIKNDFFARIIKDHRTDFNRETSFGLSYLDIASMGYRTITGLPDNIIALVCSFALEHPFVTNISELVWTLPSKT